MAAPVTWCPEISISNLNLVCVAPSATANTLCGGPPSAPTSLAASSPDHSDLAGRRCCRPQRAQASVLQAFVRAYAAKDVRFGIECRDKVLAGVNKLADAVQVTLGPKVGEQLLEAWRRCMVLVCVVQTRARHRHRLHVSMGVCACMLHAAHVAWGVHPLGLSGLCTIGAYAAHVRLHDLHADTCIMGHPRHHRCSRPRCQAAHRCTH